MKKLSTKMIVLFMIALFFIFNAYSFAAVTRLEIWDTASQKINSYMENVTAQWNKEHPDIQVDYKVIPGNGFEPFLKIGASLASGEGPDISASHIRTADDWAFAGLEAPIPESVISEKEIEARFPSYVSQWYKWDVNTGKIGTGKYYVLPIMTQNAVLYINLDLFKKAGINPAIMDKNLTWNTLIKTAKKLTIRDKNGRLQQAGFTSEGHGWVWWQTITYSQGGHIYKQGNTKSGYVSSADSKESIRALQLLVRLFKQDKVYDPGFMNWSDAFGTGKAAMAAGWGWFGYYLKDNYPDINYKAVVIPTFTGKPPYGMHRPAEKWLVPSAKGNKNYDDHKDAIWKFYKECLMRDDVIDRLIYLSYCVPTYKPILDNKNLMAKYYRDSVMAVQLKMLPNEPFVGDEINEEFDAAIEMEQNLLYKNQTVPNAVNHYMNKVNQALNERYRWITPKG